MLTNIRYEILGLRFAGFGDNADGVAQVMGRARMTGYSSEFEMMLAPLGDGRWQIRHLGWRKPPPPALSSKDFLQQLVDRCAKFLHTVNMWPSSQDEKGAQLWVNQKVIPPEHDERVIVSFRSDMLAVPSAPWPRMWDHIERRLTHDPYFRVLGFDHNVVKSVLPRLKTIFTPAWVKARYRRAGLNDMTGQIEPDNEGFFPAYHLARTAHGVICRDPGWNYLVEIGLALETLDGVDGLDRLAARLAAETGTQHHLCLAAELHKRGLLIGLEPPTGSGSASCDVLAALDGHRFQIEVKEFSSRNPLKRLRKELADKAKKLPNQPTTPVVFHVVFRETGAHDVQIEREFFRTIFEISNEIPPQISAVIAGRRFVDSYGGFVKRDCETVITNDQALLPASEDHLRAMFRRNYEEAHLPYYDLGTLFIVGQKPPTQP